MSDTKTSERKQRTITLTDLPPVRIYDDEWPEVATASAKDYDSQHESQANRRSSMVIKVRQHADGRTLVYGIYDYTSNWQNERSRSLRAGELVERAGDTAPIIAAINCVADDLAERIGEDHFGLDIREVARECIADLPPVEL